MKPLAEVLPNIENTATALEKNSLISSAGSETSNGNAITTFQPPRRPKQDEIPDILSKLHTLKPWLIQPEDQKAVKNASKILAWTTIPATYDEASYWIARALAHFPRRESAKDGVVIADLSGAIVDRKLSLCAVAVVLEEIWQNAREDKNPWFPVSGQVLDDIEKRSKFFARNLERLQNPQKALPKPSAARQEMLYDGRKWPDMTDEDKANFWQMVKILPPAVRQTVRTILRVPDDASPPLPEASPAHSEDFSADKDSAGAERPLQSA